MITRKRLLLILLTLLLAPHLSCSNGEHCQGSNGEFYYCAGFCCIGLGCCSYSSLWYAWVLLALIVLMCLCGCAGCGARRYHRRGDGYRNLMSYSSHSNEVCMTRENRNRKYNRKPRSYNSAAAAAVTRKEEPTQQVPATVEPPAYTAPSAPPPYSYY